MKQSKRVVMCLVGLNLLLLGYSVFNTIRTSRLEQRVRELELSTHKLGLKLIDTMLTNHASPIAVVEAKVEFLRDSLGIPPATFTPGHPTANDVNSVPQGVKSK